jgi:hypothetical protein
MGASSRRASAWTPRLSGHRQAGEPGERVAPFILSSPIKLSTGPFPSGTVKGFPLFLRRPLNETPAKPSLGRNFPRYHSAKEISNETTTGGLPQLQDAGRSATLVSDPKCDRCGARLENKQVTTRGRLGWRPLSLGPAAPNRWRPLSILIKISAPSAAQYVSLSADG